MDTIFLNSGNSETFESYRLLLNPSYEINVKIIYKYVALSNLRIYYTWKNIKKSYNNNKYKISAPTWNRKFELPDGSYSISDIKDHFRYINKKHETVTGNLPIRIYVYNIGIGMHLKLKHDII